MEKVHVHFTGSVTVLETRAALDEDLERYGYDPDDMRKIGWVGSVVSFRVEGDDEEYELLIDRCPVDLDAV